MSWMDALLMAVVPSSIILHLGTFLDGVNYGRATNMIWGVTFESAVVRYAVPIHPTQLYSAFMAAVLSVSMFVIYKKVKNKYPGFIAEVGIIGMSASAFLEGFFRGDDVLQLWFLRIPHLVSFGILVWFGIKMKNRLKLDAELKAFVLDYMPKRSAKNVVVPEIQHEAEKMVEKILAEQV